MKYFFKGGFINFGNVEPRILIATCQGINNDIIGCLPADINKFLSSLKQIANYRHIRQRAY